MVHILIKFYWVFESGWKKTLKFYRHLTSVKKRQLYRLYEKNSNQNTLSIWMLNKHCGRIIASRFSASFLYTLCKNLSTIESSIFHFQIYFCTPIFLCALRNGFRFNSCSFSLLSIVFNTIASGMIMNSNHVFDIKAWPIEELKFVSTFKKPCLGTKGCGSHSSLCVYIPK